jgi:hypothetical protein
MKLHFPWNDLTPIFEEIDTASTARELYGRATDRGLWIVGDRGVYVMPNTTDGIHHKGSDKTIAVYATECDPTKLDFDIWWAVKQQTFGGDDGVDYLHIDELRGMAQNPPKPGMIPLNLVVEFTPQQMALGVEWGPPVP